MSRDAWELFYLDGKGERKRMTWNEFDNSANLSFAADGQVRTDIECPMCGKKVLWDSRVVLTSLPPQYSYWCTCGWSGTSYRKWGKE